MYVCNEVENIGCSTEDLNLWRCKWSHVFPKRLVALCSFRNSKLLTIYSFQMYFNEFVLANWENVSLPENSIVHCSQTYVDGKSVVCSFSIRPPPLTRKYLKLHFLNIIPLNFNLNNYKTSKYMHAQFYISMK